MSFFEASREDDFFFPSIFCPFFGEKKIVFAKMKKKVRIRTFFNHPAATPETEVILVWPITDSGPEVNFPYSKLRGFSILHKIITDTLLLFLISHLSGVASMHTFGIRYHFVYCLLG